MFKTEKTYKLVASLSIGERNRVTQHLGSLDKKKSNIKITKAKALFAKLKELTLKRRKKVSHHNLVRLKIGDSEKREDLGVIYRYLYPRILEGIILWGYTDSEFIQKKNKIKKSKIVQWRILSAQFLFDKSLYEQAFSQLMEGKKIAEKLFGHPQILMVNNLIIDIKNRTVGKELSKQINEDKITLEIERHSECLRVQMKYRRVRVDLNRLSRKNQTDLNKREIEKQFGTILNEEQLPSESYQLGRKHFYQNSAIYHRLLAKTVNNTNEKALELQLYYCGKAITYNEKAIEWWNKHTEYRIEELYKYLMTLNNCAQTLVETINYLNLNSTIENKSKYEETFSSNNKKLRETLNIIQKSMDGIKVKEQLRFKAAYLKNYVNSYSLEKKYTKTYDILSREEEFFHQFKIKDQVILRCQFAYTVFGLSQQSQFKVDIIECYRHIQCGKKLYQEEENVRKDLRYHLFFLEGIVFTIINDDEKYSSSNVFKGTNPIKETLAYIKDTEESNIQELTRYIIDGLTYLNKFNDYYLTPDISRREQINLFAQHIYKHLPKKHSFIEEIWCWLKNFSWSRNLDIIRNSEVSFDCHIS